MYFNEDDEAHEQDLLESYQAECERLEKENKKLKEERNELRHNLKWAALRMTEGNNQIKQRFSEILRKHESGEENDQTRN